MVEAALADSPAPVESGDELVPGDVVEEVLPGAVVVEDVAPGLALADDPGVAPVPAAGVDPEVLELPALAGVVTAGFGFVAGGLLDELEGLGLGDGLGVLAVAAGGALLGAAPDPNANPMTLPGAGL